MNGVITQRGVPEKLAGVCLGGPACGLEVETDFGGPGVILVETPMAGEQVVDAYAWTGRTEVSTGRWVWQHECPVGRKGGQP
jgi:hypothetical protein